MAEQCRYGCGEIRAFRKVADAVLVLSAVILIFSVVTLYVSLTRSRVKWRRSWVLFVLLSWFKASKSQYPKGEAQSAAFEV